ncbi:MAG TPA: hypothetical protein VG889_20120 [Rhizomicrobium sp.]|nr:hypothetical protein [Rhizomicrobium sp.]
MTAAIAGVPTAVPVFIGYTKIAPAAPGAVRLSMLSDYVRVFGGAPDAKYAVVPGTAQDNDFAVGGSFYRLERVSLRFNLYMAICLFFANGGQDCFVVSVGDYSDPVAKQDLLDGLAVAGNTSGPTMVVVPDACLLAAPGDYGAVAVAQLAQCAALDDRVAILDLPNALDPVGWTSAGLAASRAAFLAAVAPAASAFDYGAAYAPALAVSVFGDDDIDMAGLQGLPGGADPGQVKALLLDKLNVATPSGAIAGICANTDTNVGVWKAPAGVVPLPATAPTVALGDADMSTYQPNFGSAVNLIRTVANEAPVVFGSYTLNSAADGGDQYRYLQVRRTLVYIKTSIAVALNQFVSDGNDAQTWNAAAALADAFLTTLCRQGAFASDTLGAAFAVTCGLGATMTAQDILDGRMIMQVEVILRRPGEVAVLRIEQAMQGS